VAAIFFGGEAFSYNNGYSWISILVNIPATIFATAYYEFLMRDSLQKIHAGHAEHEGGEEGLSRYLSKVTGQDIPIQNGSTERGMMNAANGVYEKQF
jgi:hypothetical protein